MATRAKKKNPLEIRLIRLDDIITPTEYQRELNQKRVDKMAADFRPEECGVIPVTDRGDGTFAATDGQHRVEMLRIIGIEEWPCHVMERRPIHDEARVFVDLQTERVGLTGRDKWRARRVAKDPIVIGVEEVVTDLGLDVSTGKRTSWRQIQATSALERIYLNLGPRHLAETLRVVGNAWPESMDTFKNPVVLGAASFLYYYRDDPMFRRGEVADKWSAFSLKRIIQHSKELSTALSSAASATYSGRSGVSWSPGMVAALVQAYNYKRSTRQIELPTLSGWKAMNKRARVEMEERNAND